MFGGRFQYLTIISMWVSMIYQSLQIILPRSTKYICNYLILPTFILQLIVFVLFWTLYSIDPSLVQNKKLEREATLNWINNVLMTHLLPSIVMSVEWWLHCTDRGNNKQTDKSKQIDKNNYKNSNHTRKIHKILITTWSGLYLIWIICLYRINGRWVYPFLKLLNFWQWTMLATCSLALGLLLESICK